MYNFHGLISPDPVEVVRESIISIFSPEVSRNDTCRLCKKSNKSDPNIKVTPMGLYQSRRLLRGTLQCLQLRGHEDHFDYYSWGGVHWELRLCGECTTILKRLSDKYFELEKMRLEFGELRGRTAKEVVVDKLGLPVGMYDKWERELLKPEETMWRMFRRRNTRDVGVGGDGGGVGLKEQLEADFDLKDEQEEVKVEEEEEEEGGGNFFEEMEIEPEVPEPLLPVVPPPRAEKAVDLDVGDVRVTTILPATANKQQQSEEKGMMKTTTRDVGGSSENISKVLSPVSTPVTSLTERSAPFTSGAEKQFDDDECVVIVPQNQKKQFHLQTKSSVKNNTQVSPAGRSNSSTSTTLKTYGRNRNKSNTLAQVNPAVNSVDPPPPPLEVLAVCTKGHGHHRKAVNNEVNLPGLRKELTATMLSSRNKPVITYGRKPPGAAFPPAKKSCTERPKEVRNKIKEKEAPWRMSSTAASFFDETETDINTSSSSSNQNPLTVSIGLSSNSRRKQTLSMRTYPGINNEEKREELQKPSEIVFLDDDHNNEEIKSEAVSDEDDNLLDLVSDDDESDSDISVPDVDPLAPEEDSSSSSSKEKEKIYPCRYCSREFQSSRNLNNHIRFAHKKEWERIGRRHKFHRCSLCPTPAYYKRTGALKLHMRTVHKVAIAHHPCPSCPETFDGPIRLLRHREEAHDYQPPPKGSVQNCAICDKKCLSQKALWAHLENEHSVVDDSTLRIQCSHCEESFLDNSLLHLHQVKVHFLKPEGYDHCQYCLMVMSNQKMPNHIRKTHKVKANASAENSPEKISCSVCKSITADEEDQNKLNFDSVDKLEEHAKSKEHVDLVESIGMTNVFCGVCRLSFGNDTAELAEHLRSEEHTREQCEVSRIMNAANTGGNSNPSLSFCSPCRNFCVTRIGLAHHQKCSIKHLRLVAEFRGRWILNKIPRVPETPKEQFECPTCSKVFTEQRNLNNHVKKIHKAFHPCEYCEQKFKNRKDLFSHLRVHKDVIPVKAICPHCGKGFHTNTRLTEHIRRYHQGDPSICELCGKTFSTPASLKKHIQNFHETSLSCSICSMSFKKTIRLRRHSYLKHKEEYTKDAPFVCLLCFHKFPLQEDLDNHSAAHDSTKCRVCSKPFYSIGQLQKHMKVKHDPERRKKNLGDHKCEICGKVSLGRMGAWNHRMWHERKNTPPAFACGECGKKFFVEKWLGWHKKKTGHK